MMLKAIASMNPNDMGGQGTDAEGMKAAMEATRKAGSLIINFGKLVMSLSVKL